MTDASSRPRHWARAASRLKGVVHDLHDGIGRLSGDCIPRPGARELLAQMRSMDEEENQALALPDGSHLEMQGVWALEIYTPSTIEGALARMRKRGWARSFHHSLEPDLVGWLQARRREGASGELPVRFIRPGDRGFFSLSQDADLPTFARSAHGQLLAITPSISALLLFFVARPDVQGAIEKALRDRHRSRIRSQGRSILMIDALESRRETVEALRMGWRREIAAFFRDHAPGVFAEREDDAGPTCELLVTNALRLFEVRGENDPPRTTIDAIEARYAHGLYDAQADASVCLAVNPCRHSRLETHSILWADRPAFENSVHRLDPTHGAARHLHGADARFRHGFLQNGLSTLLDVYARRLHQARDEGRRIFRSPLGLGPLKTVQGLTASLSDSALVARELADYAENGWFDRGGDYVWTRRRIRPREDKTTLSSDVRNTLRHAAARLAITTRELNEYLSTQANLASARANLWLQVIVTAFAILGLAFGGISAFEASINLLRSSEGQQSHSE